MNPSFITQLKVLFIGVSAFAASLLSNPTHITQSFAAQAPNVGSSSGTSRNWSGYSATNGTFTSITGTWTIPSVSGNGHTSADATWVGIGGIKSQDLIQAGTQNIISSSGQVSTSAFIETLPDAAQSIPVTVATGDSVTMTLTQSSAGQWQITFKNNTNGQSYNTTLSYSSSLSSAEWIEEAPSNGRTELPLDNFNSVSFSGGSTVQNGNTVSISQSGAQSITMVNSAGQTVSSASGIGSDGASFTVTRSSAISSSPIPQYDKNPHGWRRHSEGIGGFSQRTRRQFQFITPTETPSVSPTPTDSSSPSANFGRRFHRRFMFERFQ